MFYNPPLNILILEDIYEKNGAMISKDRIAAVYGIRYENTDRARVYKEFQVKDDDNECYVWIPESLIKIIE